MRRVRKHTALKKAAIHRCYCKREAEKRDFFFLPPVFFRDGLQNPFTFTFTFTFS